MKSIARTLVILFPLFFVFVIDYLISAGSNLFNVNAQSGSVKVELKSIVSGLDSPVYITHSGDGTNRLFIIEQKGRIRLLKDQQLITQPFLDITSRVNFGGERGLLGLAFHPKYATNGRFFVDYTRKDDGATVIAEYKVSNNADIAQSNERILLIIPQPFANHNGGQIAFGPDGNLYIGMGDGGSAGDPMGNGQNNRQLLGKILRINVDGKQPYESPADNPFVSNGQGSPEIYATGFRNPYRFSFDRKTGELYVGDVGQSKLEEVDIVVKGGNYGWNSMEGSICYQPSSGCNMSGLVLPITEYNHDAGNCSITGGYVYRGTQSSALSGRYIYGDYCSGTIFSYKKGTTEKLLESGFNISSFGEDEQGEIYVVNYDGAIFKLMGPIDITCALTCPQDITVTDLDGNGSEVVNFSLPQSNGTCDQITSSINSGTAFPVGITNVKFVSSTGNGSCSFNVTVKPLADTTPPVVTVLSPNGGEAVRAGKKLHISWQSNDDGGIASHEIQLSNDSGQTFTTIASGIAANAQTFAFKLPNKQIKTKQARIKVIATDLNGNRGEDSSDADFRIQKKAAN